MYNKFITSKEGLFFPKLKQNRRMYNKFITSKEGLFSPKIKQHKTSNMIMFNMKKQIM